MTDRSARASTPTSPLLTANSPGGRSPISRHAGRLFADMGKTINLASLSGQEDNATNRSSNRRGDETATEQEQALSELEQKLGREEAHELQELFKLVDKDGGGSISQDEFVELLSSMSVRPNPSEVQLMYDELDRDGDGTIEYTEFLKFMTSPVVQSASGTSLLEAFQTLEGYQYECGKNHPTQAGKTGRFGVLNMADFLTAMRTYAPDKIPNDKDAADLVKHMKRVDGRGFFDYTDYVAANVNAETMPRKNSAGEYVVENRAPTRRPRGVRIGGLSAAQALEQAVVQAKSPVLPTKTLNVESTTSDAVDPAVSVQSALIPGAESTIAVDAADSESPSSSSVENPPVAERRVSNAASAVSSTNDSKSASRVSSASNRTGSASASLPSVSRRSSAATKPTREVKPEAGAPSAAGVQSFIASVVALKTGSTTASAVNSRQGSARS